MFEYYLIFLLYLNTWIVRKFCSWNFDMKVKESSVKLIIIQWIHNKLICEVQYYL